MESLRDLLLQNGSVDVYARFPLPQQDEMARTIAEVRPLNSRILFFFRRHRKPRFALALLLWGLLVPGVYVGLRFLLSSPLSPNERLELAYLVGLMLLGFSCVHVGLEWFREDASSLTRLQGDPRECDAARSLIQAAFRLAPQLLFTTFSITWVAVLAMAYGAGWQAPEAMLRLALWLFVIGVLIGNGVYWALVTPEYVRFVCGCQGLVYDPLRPAETPGLRDLSSLLGTYAIMNAVVYTTGLLHLANASGAGDRRDLILIAHALMGGAVVLYSFVFPQFRLLRLIGRLNCEAEIHLIAEQRRFFADGHLDDPRLAAVTNLLEAIRSSPAAPRAALLIWKYATTAAIPIVAYVATRHDLGGAVWQLFGVG